VRGGRVHVSLCRHRLLGKRARRGAPCVAWCPWIDDLWLDEWCCVPSLQETSPSSDPSPDHDAAGDMDMDMDRPVLGTGQGEGEGDVCILGLRLALRSFGDDHQPDSGPGGS
jgi:hypothetical protein